MKQLFVEDNECLIRLALQTYFLLTSVAVIFVRFIPPLRQSFIPYGKTLSNRSRQPPQVFQWLANITVPKNWFWQYYLLSVSLSIFWGYQVLVCSSGESHCFWQKLSHVDGRTTIVWVMMLVQGGRRLCESLFLQRRSTARMWIGHYLVGCAFYTAMSVAVFADGRSRPLGVSLWPSILSILNRHVIAAIGLFVTASMWQFHVHKSLAALQPSFSSKAIYSPPPPSSISFQLFLTPHYTAEIIIYLAMVLVTRSATLATALIWVITNLSISSGETRIWAHNKFKDQEWGRWNILPFIY
jgi:3-oxo-5-alpha-steroid 4-dehydrogenase 3 / polyprenol reductase